MTVKEREDDVPLKEKMKLLNPLLTSNYYKHLFNFEELSASHIVLWTGLVNNNLAETTVNLEKAMDKKNGNDKKDDSIPAEELCYNQIHE